MGWIDIVIVFVLIVFQLLCIIISSSARRASENSADILQNRLKEYESEKGRNLATKEDIGDITRRIENIKSEIGLINQKTSDYINERKRLLLDILYNVERIQYGINRFVLYSRNHSSSESLYRLNDEMNVALLNLTHNSHLVLAEFDQLVGISAMTNLVDHTALLVGEIVTKSHNVAISIDIYNTCLKQAESHDFHRDSYLANAVSAQESINENAHKPFINKDIVDRDLDVYIEWLTSLFGKGLNFKYRLAE